MLKLIAMSLMFQSFITILVSSAPASVKTVAYVFLALAVMYINAKFNFISENLSRLSAGAGL